MDLGYRLSNKQSQASKELTRAKSSLPVDPEISLKSSFENGKNPESPIEGFAKASETAKHLRINGSSGSEATESLRHDGVIDRCWLSVSIDCQLFAHKQKVPRYPARLWLSVQRLDLPRCLAVALQT
jgi:hypothetical protein